MAAPCFACLQCGQPVPLPIGDTGDQPIIVRCRACQHRMTLRVSGVGHTRGHYGGSVEDLVDDSDGN